MRIKTVETGNLNALARAHEVATGLREQGKPGIEIVHGLSGLGKTTAIIFVANECDGVMIEAKPIWTPRWMLSDIMRELGAAPSNRSQEIFEFIVRDLKRNPRPIFIDEADRIAAREILVETLRAIHDATNVPFVLVGMDQFKRRAALRPQLARRVCREVEFKPATLDDARLLARELCEIEVADDVIVELHRRAHGSIGLLIGALGDAEKTAKKQGAKIVNLADFAKEARS
jgi:DNA transposition AAA+ family ATPase